MKIPPLPYRLTESGLQWSQFQRARNGHIAARESSWCRSVPQQNDLDRPLAFCPAHVLR